MMIFAILVLILCCNLFGGWGILVSIGIFVLILFAAISDQSKRINQITKNRGVAYADLQVFRPTKSIENTNVSDYAVYIDEARRKIMFANIVVGIEQTYRFDEIVECSILEDGSAIQTGGIGRAVAGGFIAGGVGAVVGASTRKTKPVVYSLSVRVITTSIQNSLYEIPLITSKTDKETESYREIFQFAQEVYAVVTSVVAIAKRQQIQR